MAELTPQQKATLERLKAQVAKAEKQDKSKEGTLADDVGGAAKTAAKETGKFIMDNVISGDSWKDIVNGQATKGDYANAFVDVASVAVPGGALLGGAARMGARRLVEQAGKHALADRAVKSGAAKAVTPVAKRLVGQHAKGGAGKVGRQIGLAQSKRVAGRNALVLGAANVSDNLYGAARGRTTATGDPVDEGSNTGAGAGAGLGASWALLDADGGVVAEGGPAIEKAMSRYNNRGGAPAGMQVVYMGR